jgi:Zn-dependent M28 family amino/carboxypeptidase
MTVDVELIQRPVAKGVGVPPGSDRSLADQYIIVGAHYDHLGLGQEHSLAPREIGQIHHGADDNASSTSGVLEPADAFAHASHRLRHSIVFIWFAGEQLGFWARLSTRIVLCS